MSLYCKNKECPRHKECARYKFGEKYQDQTVEGLWWVYGCSQRNNFDDFVKL